MVVAIGVVLEIVSCEVQHSRGRARICRVNGERAIREASGVRIAPLILRSSAVIVECTIDNASICVVRVNRLAARRDVVLLPHKSAVDHFYRAIGVDT